MQEDFFVEGIDIQAGKARYSENTFIDVLRAYNKHTPALLDVLRCRESIEEYITSVHGIKGASSGICANEVARQAAALEAAARSGDMQYVDAHNGPFIETVTAMLRQLDDLLAAAAEPAGNKQVISKPDPALLKDFAEACNHYNISAMNDILGKLEMYQYEADGELVEWLREQTENLEYDAIQQRLESIT